MKLLGVIFNKFLINLLFSLFNTYSLSILVKNHFSGRPPNWIVFSGASITEEATARNPMSYCCWTSFFRKYRGRYDMTWVVLKVRFGVRCSVRFWSSWIHIKSWWPKFKTYECKNEWWKQETREQPILVIVIFMLRWPWGRLRFRRWHERHDSGLWRTGFFSCIWPWEWWSYVIQYGPIFYMVALAKNIRWHGEPLMLKVPEEVIEN